MYIFFSPGSSGCSWLHIATQDRLQCKSNPGYLEIHHGPKIMGLIQHSWLQLNVFPILLNKKFAPKNWVAQKLYFLQYEALSIHHCSPCENSILLGARLQEYVEGSWHHKCWNQPMKNSQPSIFPAQVEILWPLPGFDLHHSHHVVFHEDAKTSRLDFATGNEKGCLKPPRTIRQQWCPASLNLCLDHAYSYYRYLGYLDQNGRHASVPWPVPYEIGHLHVLHGLGRWRCHASPMSASWNNLSALQELKGKDPGRHEAQKSARKVTETLPSLKVLPTSYSKLRHEANDPFLSRTADLSEVLGGAKNHHSRTFPDCW